MVSAPGQRVEVLVVHDDGLGLDFGPGHPSDGRRHRLTMALAREVGLLDRPNVALLPGPEPMSDDDLHRVFAPAFVAAIKRYSQDPIMAKGWDASQWGIDGDNGAFLGMHEASARICSSSALGARAVVEGRARRAFLPVGGIHHAMANRAQGFGIYNDTAMSIREMLDAGAERVAYVDVDVHHGNGTQWIYYGDPRVLTVSVHESGRYLFPGSGFPHEIGTDAGEGRSVNVAMPPDAGDDAYRAAMDRVVVPIVTAFKPDAIVTQCGVDTHHADPLSHVLTTIALYPWMWKRLSDLADDVCGGRWVAFAGGGYEPCSVPPRAWTMLLAQLAGATLPDVIPEGWRVFARSLGCPEPATRFMDDPGPEPNAERDATAATLANRAIDETLAAVGRFWRVPAT